MKIEQSENIQDNLKELYIKQSIDIYKRNADLIGELMVFNDIENVPINEWNELWDTVKKKGIKLRKGDCVFRDKQINIFEKYTIEELKELYNNRKGLYVITQYFIDELSKKNYKNEVLIELNNAYTSLILHALKTNADYCITNKEPRSKKEYDRWMHKSDACEHLSFLLDDNRTESDIYQFVFYNLQYAKVEDLKRLIKLADNNFIINSKGRKSRNKKIFKYDSEHNLLATYPNRNACIEIENVSKQSLYNVLSGKRKTLNGYIYEEEK